MTGDFTTHHRGARPNRAGDTHLGQGSFQPHHNRRAILNTEHPTTAHNRPLQQHCYHTNCLHPMTPSCTVWCSVLSNLNAHVHEVWRDSVLMHLMVLGAF